MAGAVPEVPSEAPKAGGVFFAIRRRVRARILRGEEKRPLTVGRWFADLGKVIGTLASLGILATLVAASNPLYRAASIWLFGYRPIGSVDDVLALLLLLVAIPTSFLAFVFCMVMVMWTYESMKWLGLQIAIATPAVGIPFLLFNWFVLGPPLNNYQHLNTWPAQLQLVSFNVCSVTTRDESTRILAPVGKITIGLMNRAEVAVSDAVFSVKAGSNWYHLSVSELPPHTMRAVTVERDLGIIEIDLANSVGGRARRSGEIYWDHVKPRDLLEHQTSRRPGIATVSPISPCPVMARSQDSAKPRP